MEVIRIPGYTENEKDSIAEKYLMPKQLENNGLTDKDIKFNKNIFMEIIRSYTREAGVRNLEREISKVCRKVVKKLLLNKKLKSIKIDMNNLVDYLGVKRFKHGEIEKENVVGLVNGLAWTEAGGELLSVETAVIPGKGKFILTGQLGDVMQESIKAAMTIVRKRALNLGIDKDFYENKDIHVHFPEGATPKDGPSAGVGITTSLVSTLTENPVKSSVAMTGEVNLHGQVLPIGGLKEKMLAALRAGIKTVIIPLENEKDLAEIPSNIKDNLEIKTVEWVEEVLLIALENPIAGLELPVSKIIEKSENKDTLTH
jgi:ATP-dependent Lon protease